MLEEIENNYYCSAGLYDGINKLKVIDVNTNTQITGTCVDVCDNCSCKHRKWPTPDQFKEVFGFDYPDDAAVYVLEHNGDEYYWNIYDWGSFYKACGQKTKIEIFVCACTPFGAPPKDWRPNA